MSIDEIVKLSQVGHVRFDNMEQALAIYLSAENRSKGLIYVGANTGQELPICKHYADKIYAFEPITNPSVWNQLILHEDYNTYCLNYALTDHNDVMCFHTSSNNFESSSLFEPQERITEFPDVKFTDIIFVKCRRLDHFHFVQFCDVLIMDVQGAELSV